jgi:hypothetical protein
MLKMEVEGTATATATVVSQPQTRPCIATKNHVFASLLGRNVMAFSAGKLSVWLLCVWIGRWLPC